MKKYNDNDYKKILGRLLKLSLTNIEPAKELIEQMFDDDEFKEQAICLCDSYLKPEYRNSTLISRTIDVRALPSLVKICKRDKLGIIPLDFTGEENHIYENGDKINILFLSLQEKQFQRAALEACAISGVADEITRRYVDTFARELKNKNPMVEITGVSESVYSQMKEQLNNLPESLKFTFFPQKTEDGKINVGFFYKTDEKNVKKGKRTEKNGPYVIPKIASTLLACALLTNNEKDYKFEEELKKNKEIMKIIMDMYNEDEKIYLVPAIINKNKLLNVFMDKALFVDFYAEDSISYDEYKKYINSKMAGLNHTLIVMNEHEFLNYKKEITLSPKMLSFYKKAPIPEYVSPETSRGREVSKRLIDILNRKREQILLMSDDFNGENLINIENYITGSVQEIIMREDEDYTDYIETDELLDRKELELLNELDKKYKMSYVYEDHDKVSELINAERNSLEVIKPSREKEELEL